MQYDSVDLVATEISEREALLMYLTAQHPGEQLGFMSSFQAVLHDARGVTRRDGDGVVRPGQDSHSSAWIGAVAYLTFMDQIGTALTLRDRPKEEPGNAVRLCLRDFAPNMPARDVDAIYALRCALVHDFSLFNMNPDTPRMKFHFGFVADTSSPLVAHSQEQWTGKFDGINWATTQTTINLRAIGDLGEACNRAVMEAWHAGRVQSRLEPAELVIRYGIFYNPEQDHGQGGRP
jgi:hypothetical protein